MQVKCEYCDNYIDDVAEQCSFCGAPNINKVRAADAIPRTIAELQAFCREKNLNLERMHFHIGEDYRGPKAFGIYEQGGRYIVYKNKSDGSRAVRYDGTDEAYAVNEIYQKMKVEILEVREAMAAKGSTVGPGSSKKSKRSGSIKDKIGTIMAVLVLTCPFWGSGLMWLASAFIDEPERGYYQYDGDTYYYGYQGWYSYDTGTDSWIMGGEPSVFAEDYSSYWQSYDYSDTYSAPSFSTSDYWDTDNNWNDNWDSDDWDWASSSSNDTSWDSGWDTWADSGNDWDSDW